MSSTTLETSSLLHEVSPPMVVPVTQIAVIKIAHQITRRFRLPAAAPKKAKAKLRTKSHRQGNWRKRNSGTCLHSQALGGSIKTTQATERNANVHQTFRGRRCLKLRAMPTPAKSIPAR